MYFIKKLLNRLSATWAKDILRMAVQIVACNIPHLYVCLLYREKISLSLCLVPVVKMALRIPGAG
jgi:hypothetical protein